jgi:hypothetical protein
MNGLKNSKNVQPDLAKSRDFKEEPRLATWGDVFWAWIIKGYPREEAAFRADEWEKRRERERSGIPGRLNRKARRAMKARAAPTPSRSPEQPE